MADADLTLRLLRKLDTKIDAVDAKVTAMDSRLSVVDSRVDKLDAKVDRLEEKIDAFRDYAEMRFAVVDAFAKFIKTIDVRMRKLEARAK